MTYNVYLNISLFGSYNIFELSENQIQIIVQAFKKGDSSFTISGTKYDLDGVKDFADI